MNHRSLFIIVQLHSTHLPPEMAAVLHVGPGVTQNSPDLLERLDTFKVQYLEGRANRLSPPADEEVSWHQFYFEPYDGFLTRPNPGSIAVLMAHVPDAEQGNVIARPGDK